MESLQVNYSRVVDSVVFGNITVTNIEVFFTVVLSIPTGRLPDSVYG